MRSVRPLLRLSVLAGAGLALAVTSALAADKTFNDEQTRAIEETVHNYLVTHPEVLIEAMQALDKKEAAAAQAQARSVIEKNSDVLFHDPSTYVAGNPKGNVSIVEFFDYQCGYCRANFEPLREAVKQDGNIRFVLKEWPVLGPASRFAAKAAMAARQQGKYLEFHNALFGLKGGLTEERVFDTAAKVGLDVTKLQKDMKDPAVEKALTRNNALAQALGFEGTPSFVIGKDAYKGLLHPDEIGEYVAKARDECGQTTSC